MLTMMRKGGKTETSEGCRANELEDSVWQKRPIASVGHCSEHNVQRHEVNDKDTMYKAMGRTAKEPK